ncbi:SWIB/MDM2 domain-containing protein [Russula aff. rugulosa BPL654]|nr:SWIB/MDM2 domain-containing protein [Russula aff. rugulosa BPL654]
MQVPDLEPRIHAILSAPGTDLSTISAKRDLIKDNKQAIDKLISNIFARVSEEKGFQQDEEEGDAEGGRTASAEPPVAPKKRSRTSIVDRDDRSSAKSAKLSTAGDEALARKLSEQINGRERSSRSAASGASPVRGSRGRGRGKARGRGRGNKANGAKSADTIDDSGSEGDETKKKKGGGLSKEYILSEPLAALVEENMLSRPQVVKKLWAYIKTNSLQNPTNGREIMCDGALRAVFNTDKIDMFKMNKELGK